MAVEVVGAAPWHTLSRHIWQNFEKMIPNEFQNRFNRWIEAVAELTRGQVIAIDGKTLRRSHDKSGDKKAIHMVSAWASENQKNLCHDVGLFFDDMEGMKQEGYSFDEETTVDSGHGRIETRRTVTTSDIDWIHDKDNWPGLKSIGMIESVREIEGQCSQEKQALNVMQRHLAALSGSIGGLKILFTGF